MSEFHSEMSNKKICYIVTIPLTIEAFFIPQLKYLAQCGFSVSVICSPSDSLQEKLGDSVRFIPCEIPRGLSVLGSLRAIAQLRRIFAQEKFDLVQYSTPNAALYASIAAKLAGCKIRNYHLMGLRYLGASGIGRIVLKTIEKITCGLSTSIECVSPSNLRLALNEGIFPEKKGTVVWNGSSGGVDLSRFDFSKRDLWRREVREELGLSANDFVFGFAGRITRDKGINEILAAYQSINCDAKLLFVGNPEGLDTLDQKLLTQAKQDARILFHESVKDIERYYAAMDVLLLPSYREGFGNVIIEAAACGTPAIVSNIPGPIDAVEDGKTAIVVTVRDAETLAKAMQKCVSGELFDPMCCAQFADSQFDSVKLLEAIYQRKKILLGRSV